MNKPLIALLSLAALCGLPTLTQAAAESPAAPDARMAWWREAKFGMFIHWGLYAIPAGGEWHMRKNKVPMAEYQKFVGQFNPTQFNADEWASLAQDAGMKYMVLTTKHHDGFAMFQSKASDYNITDATPFKRDPLKELSVACPKHDVKLCTYYSILADWGHPGGGAGEAKWDKAQEGSLDDYINKVAVPQVKELLTNYGPIGVMWFDNDGTPRATAEQVARIAEALKLQPQTFSVLRLTIPYTEATKLLLEVKDGQAWKPVWSEENPKGTSFVKTFPPVTGQVVRLTVTSPKPELRVGVFELFPPL